LARDNVYPSDLEQKNMVRAEFLRGAATAFALCWRGEESSQCLEAAKGLHESAQVGLTGRPRPAPPARSKRAVGELAESGDRRAPGKR
jgi:hypothetical protein